MSDPWERMEGESIQAFNSFVEYRDMQPKRVVNRVKNKSAKNWSQKYKWVDRAKAYDDFLDEIRRKEQQKDIAKMRDRHAKVATEMLDKAQTALAMLDPDDVSAQDIARLVDIATKLERISRGDAGEVVEQREAEDKAPSPIAFYMPTNSRNPELEN